MAGRLFLNKEILSFSKSLRTHNQQTRSFSGNLHNPLKITFADKLSNDNPSSISRINLIEKIAAQDIAHPPRGIASIAQAMRGNLYKSAKSISLTEKPRVAIMTGFWIKKRTIIGIDGKEMILGDASETDGPVGCAHLAAGLVRAGIPVQMVTDEPNASAVKVALDESIREQNMVIPFQIIPWTIPTSLSSKSSDHDIVKKASVAIQMLIKKWKEEEITHVMALERVGPAVSDGCPHNMIGLDISAFTAPLHLLYEGGPWVKLAVGDGGNEMGMGSVDPKLIAKSIFNGKGDIMACKVKADYLQVCGVSNWGGPSLLFALALLRPELADLLLAGLTLEKDKEILKATVEKGPAVDGIRGTKELSVDNMDWAVHASVLEQMWNAYKGGSVEIIGYDCDTRPKH